MAEINSTPATSTVKPIVLSDEVRERVRLLLETNVEKVLLVPELGECWLWQGSKSEAGYGQVCIGNQRHARAHRVAYVLANGHTDLHVCHQCDVPSCVNPAHLFAGTKHQNMQDCAAKGRTVYQRRPDKAPRGERHHSRTKPACIQRGGECARALLTDEQAEEIRRKYATGDYTQQELATEYGIKQVSVSEIVRYQTYVPRSDDERLDQKPIG